MAVHEFQPGPLSSRRSYQLERDGVAWRIGRRSGRIAFSDIASVRLNLTPAASQFHSACVITGRSGRRHTITEAYKPRFFGDATKRTESFMAFTRALLTAVPAANPAVELGAGPSRSEWITAVIVLTVIAATIAGGIVIMAIHGRIVWSALAFMGVLLTLAPGFWGMARSGGPKPLDPAAWLAGHSPTPCRSRRQSCPIWS
ncbi:MAG: hypothetical protein LAT81_00340 [Oceanicaulis sp.]|nr:hypothetical protein [Oceanicaulis sp.]